MRRPPRFLVVPTAVPAVVAVAVVVAAGLPPAAASGEPSAARPPATATSQADPHPNGPVVVHADPFTTGHRGLAPGQIEMTTISTRPALVTGHRVRVAVRGVGRGERLTVHRGHADVSRRFHHVHRRPGEARGVYEGLVGGLRMGPNEIRARVHGERHGTRSVRLRVVAHPIQGPLVTGPHQHPFVCETVESGLGKPQRNCTARTRVHWWWRDLSGRFHRLAHPYSAYPSDVSMTTTSRGRRVPFVVRVESRVINRSITRIAVLDDPLGRSRHHRFAAREWNRRLIYHFGESCGTGYHQGASKESNVFGSLTSISTENLAGPVLNLATRLGEGGMVAESSLTVFGVHCNEVLSAETLMMIKEHIIERYGDVWHTVAGGASGGAIQQYTISDHYPGLLDAGTPLVSFPDVITTAMTVYACLGLERVFAADTSRWTAAKQIAVSGLATPQVCKDWASLFGDNLKPTSCPGGIPAGRVYDAKTNPDGVRCDLQDDLRNIIGVNPTTGQAYRPIDDVGVQYGLKALRAGDITLDDFITLNRTIGGFNLDGVHMKKRASMSAALAHRMYRTGLVDGRGALNLTPIIDQTLPFSDETPELDIHDQVRPFETRARLQRTYGSHASLAVWSGVPYPGNAIVTAQHWLAALDRLQRQHPWWSRARLVRESRPADARDECRVGVVGAPRACDRGLARHTGPRQVAGGPFTEDMIKCPLRPVRRSDYPGSPTPAQLAAIRAAFPGGVCDYSRHPIGWTARAKTWLSYGGSTLRTTPVVVPYPLVRSARSGSQARYARTR